MSVFVSGEIGTVRYIGTTEFAEGVWLGVEFRRASELSTIYTESFAVDQFYVFRELVCICENKNCTN